MKTHHDVHHPSPGFLKSKLPFSINILPFLENNSVHFLTESLIFGKLTLVLSKNRLSFVNKSSNIGRITTTNQCKKVPDLWRRGSVKIERYYAKKAVD